MSSLNNIHLQEPESLNFTYEDFCDLLGGLSWDKAPNQYLYSPQQDSRFALEVFWLKWSLFRSFCQKVLFFHEKNQSPHLNLYPENPEIKILPIFQDVLPSRWSFAVQILQDKKPPFLDLPIPSELIGRVYQAPSNLPLVYQAPIIRSSKLGTEHSAAVIIRFIEKSQDLGDGTVKGLVETQIIFDKTPGSVWSQMDVFRILLRFPTRNASPIEIWGSLSDSQEKGLLIKGILNTVSKEDFKYLEENPRIIFNRSGVMIYPTFHVPSDAYSIGMILFRTLLVNRYQNIEMVNLAINRIIGHLEPMVSGLLEEDLGLISMRLRNLLNDEGDLFSQDSVFFEAAEQDKRKHAIPDTLWYSSLVIALKCVTTIPGFSFCRNHGDYSLSAIHEPMERILRLTDKLASQIKSELFTYGKRNSEILRACSIVQQELTSSGTGPQ